MRRISLAIALAASMLLGGMLVASADTEHGRPVVCSVEAGQVDEAGFGSRDGFDHFHVNNPAVFASLADLEGFLNNCHTNLDVQATGTAKNVSASARAVRISGVNRIQLRAQLRRFFDDDGIGPNAAAWHVVVASDSVNTGDNRTLTVTTPLLTETGTGALHFVEGWYDVNIRALVRYSNTSLVFYQRQTYAVWLGDGPAVPATPPLV